MTMEKLGIKHMGLVLFGIILLVIGLVASFYYYDPFDNPYNRTFPYQSVGIVLDIVGIAFIALGFVYSPKRTEPIKQNA